MMFLQFFIWGAWYVAMWGFMDKNGMTTNTGSGAFVDAAYTVAPIAAIFAPLTLGLIADRVCFLKNGRVAALGTLDEIGMSDHPFVKQFLDRRPEDETQDNEDYLRSLFGDVMLERMQRE